MTSSSKFVRQAVLTGVSIVSLSAVGALATPAAAALYTEVGGSLNGGNVKSVNAIAGYQVTSVIGNAPGVFEDEQFYFSGLATGIQTFNFASDVAFFYNVNATDASGFDGVFGFGSGSFTTEADFDGTLAILFFGEFGAAGGSYAISLVEADAVPLPAAAALMAPGLAALGLAGRRRRAKRRNA